VLLRLEPKVKQETGSYKLSIKSNNSDPAIIRLACEQDAERFAILSEQLGYLASVQEIQQRLREIQADEQHVIYVASLMSESVVGWVHAHICNLVITPPQALIFGLVVDRAHHHCGIGRRLMQKVEQWALAKDCHAVLVRSNIIRKEAHIFYEKIGYEQTKQSLVFTKAL
jgi:GNAT superfamily N-acetyltransferase